MQSYVEISAAESLPISRDLLLGNDKTIMSNNSGTQFPTQNLQVGMFCYRTDQGKLYQLKDNLPTWILVFDLANIPLPSTGGSYSGSVSFLGGGSILKLKSGSSDSVYAEFFSDPANQNTRTAKLGFLGGNKTLTLGNEQVDGDISIVTQGAGKVSTNAQIVSNVAKGTSPFVVTSDTLVSKLNSDLVRGYAPDTAESKDSLVLRDANGTISTTQLIVNQANNATPPLVVKYPVKVPNLNADLLDGKDTSADKIGDTVALRDSNGNLTMSTATADLVVGLSSDSSVRQLLSVGALATTSASYSASVIIVSPLPSTGTYFIINVRGFDVAKGAWELRLTGINDVTEGWKNCFAILTGNAPFSVVSFGTYNGKSAIKLGNTSTVWRYSNVVISDIIAAGTGKEQYNSPWILSSLQDESGYVPISTPTITKVWTSSNGGSGSGLNADLLRGMYPDSADTASTIVQRDAGGATAVKQLNVTAADGVSPLVVSSRTKVSNLNAELLCGLSAGNALNGIPVSNNVLNTGLNAEKVGGMTADDITTTALIYAMIL